MNVSYFISKRLRKGTTDSFSSIIHKIAVASIAIGLAAAIVSFLIMLGFQSAVKNKIYGFSNHLLVTKFTMNNAVEEQPFNFKIPLYENPERFPFVKHVQEYCHKAGLIKTESEVLGIVFKGVGRSFNQSAFAENIIEGRFIHFSDSGYAKEVLLSKVIANKIDAKVGDDIVLHFFQNPPRFRRLKVVGLYETNLSDYFDGKVLLGDIRMVQQLNGWNQNDAGGLEVAIDLNYFDAFTLWKKSLPFSSTSTEQTETDTVFFADENKSSALSFDFDKAALEEAVQQIGDSMDYDLNLESVRDKYIQVFEWLGLVKRQVKILLGIILVVVSVNMISVILILVMERTQMIGLLKAMGARDGTIRSIFVYQGIRLIAIGLFFGNVLGLGLCFLQDQFKFIQLNAHDYYMSYVPIGWDWPMVLFVNLLVFAIVTLVLLLPTAIVSRISPIKAIRFD